MKIHHALCRWSRMENSDCNLSAIFSPLFSVLFKETPAIEWGEWTDEPPGVTFSTGRANLAKYTRHAPSKGGKFWKKKKMDSHESRSRRRDKKKSFFLKKGKKKSTRRDERSRGKSPLCIPARHPHTRRAHVIMRIMGLPGSHSQSLVDNFWRSSSSSTPNVYVRRKERQTIAGRCIISIFARAHPSATNRLLRRLLYSSDKHTQSVLRLRRPRHCCLRIFLISDENLGERRHSP